MKNNSEIVMFEKEINILENQVFQGDYVVLKGVVPILFSAPHSICQTNQDGKTKLKEPYTKAISLFLNKNCNTFSMFKNNDTGIDSNKDNYDNYNIEMRRLVKKYNIKLVVDLHGASKERNFDLEFGTLNNLTSDFSTIKELEDAFRKNGFKNISYNNHFKGGAITKGIYALDDVDVIQIEINGKYRDYNNLELLKCLVDSLMIFVKKYEKYTKN